MGYLQSIANSLPSVKVNQIGQLSSAFYQASSQTAFSTLQKTKSGINTIGEVLGLLRATFRTITGLGEIVHIEEYQPLPFPKDWQKQIVIAGGHEVVVSKMSVENAIGTYIFPMGHGTEATFYKPWIDLFNKKGFNVVTIQQPTPELNEYFANGDRIDVGYKKVIADTVLNPNSIIYEDIPDWHIVSLLTHSASGQGFERAIYEDEDAAKFAEEIFEDRIFHSGIMLDTAHSSLKHAWLFSKAYDIYTKFKHVRDKKAGTTEADRYWIKEELEIPQNQYARNTQTNVTHGQAHFLKHGGIDHFSNVEKAKDLSETFRKLKRTILMGMDEVSACPLTPKDYADMIEGIHFEGIEGVKHNPFMECAKAYSIVARRTFPVARANHKAYLRESASYQAAAAASPVSALQAS